MFLKIKGIKYIGKSRVINLNVKKNHTFITSNGIITHNCDYLSPNAQAMLRDLMESVQNITRFILQCNYGNKIIPELQSRCQVIELNGPPMKDIGVHVLKILKSEGVTIKNKSAISDTIKKLYPDIRKIINTLQMNTIDGILDTVKIEECNEVYSNIFKAIKKGDLDEIRKILRSNAVNYTELYSYLFDQAGDFKSPGDAILSIGEYLYRDGIISIKEINFMAFVVDVMKRGII